MSEPAVDCPVCQKHTETDSLLSMGVILSGVEALCKRDAQTVTAVADHLTQYDGHVAVTLYTALLSDLCDMTGHDIRQVIAEHRESITRRLAEINEAPTA